MTHGAVHWASLALLLGAAHVTAQYYGEDERVLVDNKCQCVKMTSRFVPSKDDPSELILERNIRIIVPLKSRENISDPNSPPRTTFVYKMSDLCKKCDPQEIELGGEIVTATQSNCDGHKDVCYTYDRNKCYTSDIKYTYGGETKYLKAPLNRESCYQQSPPMSSWKDEHTGVHPAASSCK
ncbi:immunoglobulin J chain [Ambystoma mexicanum]|uniref:immunoglobulin J chain n=1 Tax=Ambystoma mexicanum TaxID=8296 RepID=UPI0037E91571